MRVFLILSCVLSLRAALLDRIVITVGQDAITETQLDEELAVTAFLNHITLPASTSERRAAAHRLIQQTLVGRDMQLAHFPEPEEAQVTRAMERITEDYGLKTDFERGLSQYGITADLLQTHIRRQLATLRFIEYRFRPELTVSENDLRKAYNRQAETWHSTHPSQAMPDFDASRAELRSNMIEARTDQALDNWLNQASSQERIIYLDPALRPER